MIRTPASNGTRACHPRRSLNFRDVGKGAVRLARTLGQMVNRPSQQLHQMFDAHRIARPDVEDLADRVRLRRGRKRISHVSDKGKVARLASIANNGVRLSRQLLREKHAKNRPISPGRSRPRPIDVEQPQGNCGKLVRRRPVHHVLFAQVLRQCIRIHRPGGRGFRRRIDVGNSITRARRRVDEPLHAGAAGRLQRTDRPRYVGRVILQRLTNRGNDVRKPRKVKHPLRARHRRCKRRDIGNIHLVKRDRRISLHRREIFQPPGGEAVDDRNAMPVANETFHEMASDKPGAAGDHALFVHGLHRFISMPPAASS